jgi:exodeoxyribonuclease VII large subunit
MTDSSGEGAKLQMAHNLVELSVSEVSQAIRHAIETGFDRVRVRGEISGFKRAASGHLYMQLKDEAAAIKAVCWKGVAQRLGLRPEDGMEVVATGRVTTYAERSEYQLVIERLELAGRGALLKLLEDRKKKLAAEGLFDAARKRKLPRLPDVIGVVTSPTGAVIRDILHRLADRFPRRVLLWPVLVQGEGAAQQVAAAIRGFNALTASGPLPRPDVIIVARGGGSLEDLMAFNEEVVVRAAAESRIPLIAAIGHETDQTLIDFAADLRAPTPTAAAEKAVPVRAELIAEIGQLGARMSRSLLDQLSRRRLTIEGLARGLPEPKRLLQDRAQSLDIWNERWANARAAYIRNRRDQVQGLSARLRTPREMIAIKRSELSKIWERMIGGMRLDLSTQNRKLDVAAAHLKPRIVADILDRRRLALSNLAGLLQSYSYQQVLLRGFALVRGPAGEAIGAAASLHAGQDVSIQFHDGQVGARVRSQDEK